MVLALIGLVTASFASTTYALTSITPYIDNAIFSPPSDYNIPRTLYAHSLLIAQDGNDTNVLLSTWENYSPEPPSVYFPVYRSTDLGQTWTHISNITDTVNGWGLRYQPFLYELPQPFGTYSVRSSSPSCRQHSFSCRPEPFLPQATPFRQTSVRHKLICTRAPTKAIPGLSLYVLPAAMTTSLPLKFLAIT